MPLSLTDPSVDLRESSESELGDVLSVGAMASSGISLKSAKLRSRLRIEEAPLKLASEVSSLLIMGGGVGWPS